MFIKKQKYIPMNVDLANGRLSIIIPLYAEPKKSLIAKEMIQKFELIDEIKDKTKEQELFLLCLSANLVLYFYNNKGIFSCTRTPEITLYRKKMDFYYKEIIKENFPLLPTQKSTWNALIGEVYFKIHHYELALRCYDIAIAEYSLKEKNKEKDILLDPTIQKYNIALIESYLELGYRYITDSPAPGLAFDRINNAIKLINELIQVKYDRLSQLYFFKSQALEYLSYFYQSSNIERKPKLALIKLLEALQFYIMCHEVSKSSKLKKKIF
jgi:tetratricopeptide (TPR) repeat protein